MLKTSPAACAVAVGLLVAAPLRAQEPRTDQGASTPPVESKAEPPEPSADQPPLGEKVRLYVESNRIVQSFSDDGFYPRVGGLIQGSGLAGGAGYRRHIFNGVYADVSGLV